MAGKLPKTENITRFGNRLRALRQEKGMTMKDLSFAMGVDARQIGHLERGTVDPHLSMIIRASLALQIPLAELLEIDVIDDFQS